MKRRGLPLMLALGLAAVGAGGAPAVAADIHEAQLGHSSAIVSLTGGKAGAVTFETGDAALRRFGAWIESESAAGMMTASVRTDVTDPATEVARDRVRLDALAAQRGGAGADEGGGGGDPEGRGMGWVEFEFDLPLGPGDYSVVLQADGAAGDVVWYGDDPPDEAAGPSWSYDEGYWGGWAQYGVGAAAWLADRSLAFYVNDALTAQGCAGANACWRHVPAYERHVYPAGLIGGPDEPYALTAFEATGAQYVPGSSVLALPGGDWYYVPAGADEPVVVPAGDPDAAAQIEESRAWLASGEVPGRLDSERELASRALLDLRLLLQENGAAAAAWRGSWRYSWPRDSAFMAVALARTGHLEEARRILSYNDRTLRRGCDWWRFGCVPGTWEARTLLDGSGPPDGRDWQLDANGFVPWAVWQYVEALPPAERPEAIAEFYDMVSVAADAGVQSLDARGLPPARPDYREIGSAGPNLGTAAPLLAGLRASADLALQSGESADAERWYAAADRLAAAIAATFGENGYQRTIGEGSGKDSAITWLVPPFNPADGALMTAIDETWNALVEPTGGVTPGEDWERSETWTPETMFFALAWANTGVNDRAGELVEWLDDHRTVVGAFPEKVTPEGHPGELATLGWTASLALLTLDALESPLPTPAAAASGSGDTEPAVPVDDRAATGDAVVPVEGAGTSLEAEPVTVPSTTLIVVLGLLLLAGVLTRRRS